MVIELARRHAERALDLPLELSVVQCERRPKRPQIGEPAAAQEDQGQEEVSEQCGIQDVEPEVRVGQQLGRCGAEVDAGRVDHGSRGDS